MDTAASCEATTPAGGPLWQCCVQTDDVDAHAHAQPGWDLRYEQLSPGRFEGGDRLGR